MKNSTKTNRSATNGKPPGICRSLLLATTLLGFLPPLQASEWGFNLIGQPSAEHEVAGEQNIPEIIEMTGAGKFNPEAETASGQGTFAIFNEFGEPASFFGGPDFRGTWKVTDFVGWTPDGELEVLVTLSAKVGLNEAFKDVGLDIPNILVTISEEGINVDAGFKLFAANMTGSAAFHLEKP